MRLLGASIRKVARRPATIRTLIVVALILALVYLSIGSSAASLPQEQRAGLEAILGFPAAYVGLATFLLAFGSLAAAALAGLIAGSEWSWSTFRVAIARGESRPRYILATFAGLAVLVLVGSLLLYAVGIGLAFVAASLAGFPTAGAGDAVVAARLPAILAGAGTAIITATAFGFVLSFLMKNAIAGVVAVVALSIGEQLLASVIPDDYERYGPTASGTALVTGSGRAGFSGDWLMLFAVNVAFIAVALGAAAVFARRTDVP